MPMIQKPIRFAQDSVEKLEMIAAREDRDTSYLVREAVDDLIEAREWQLKKAEETLAAIKSGDMPVASHEEAKEFLKKLGVPL